jgi:hypothetical protein
MGEMATFDSFGTLAGQRFRLNLILRLLPPLPHAADFGVGNASLVIPVVGVKKQIHL